MVNYYFSQWYPKAAPPQGSVMTTFDGVATVFGAPQSNGNSGKDIIQYDAEADQWNKIGELQIARSLPTVIEVHS